MGSENNSGTVSLTVEVKGHRAHYLKAGGGPPVVLVHGGASDSRDWLNTSPALADRFSVYAPDLIGFGRSSRRADGYYLSDFSDFILEFIERLGLKEPALVGHSLGGRVCLGVALRHPEKVSRLVLVDAAGLGRVSRFGTVFFGAFWRLRKLLRRPQPYPQFLARDGEDNDWLCVDKLPGLKTPTLLVWKRHDPYLPVSIARLAEKLIPGARLAVVPGYGHAPQVQNPAAFNRLLLDFLVDGRP